MAARLDISTFFGGKPKTEAIKPGKPMGTVGYNITGGYIVTKEKNGLLNRGERYRTFSDIIQNISIVAAGSRYFLNIISQPEWTVEPAKDIDGEESSDDAKQVAEFVEDVLFNQIETNWTRLVRRAGQYRYYGFGIEEWTAKKRPDGKIGISQIQSRPQHTIDRWDILDTGEVAGVWQRSPQTGRELYIPRKKFIYLLDDTLTDSPEGLGLLRQVVDPALRLKELVRLEGQGYSRDMRGIPIARAPLAEMADQGMSDEDITTATQNIKNFASMTATDANTYLLLDSQPYRSTSDNGENVSTTPLWDLTFAQYSASGLDEIGKAIERINYEIARVLGVEGLMIGSGSSGSRAASEDKSSNLYLQANATLDDIQEAYQRDIVGVILDMNGIDRAFMPSLTHEDVQRKDIEGVSDFIRNLATSGIVLDRGDEAVRELFTMAGLTPPEIDQLEGALEAGLQNDAG